MTRGFAEDLITFSGALVRRAAAEQGGVLSGDNPSHYNASNPIRLWVIQVIIIIGFTQILALVGSRIRQPRVIAEVIAGVLLGPTVMGRIPHFRETIFPDASMAGLSLTANIGLVLFLFIIGLEVDLSLMKRNARASATISIAGLIVPLGMGAALGVPLYNEFVDDSVNFGYFLLFVAVAIGITAFPVLCRILTELKLLDTTVGVVVLSAGVGNDVIGWVLLALTVALVNSTGGLTALWVLLTSVGYVLFLLFPVKWGYHWLARRTGSVQNGAPTTFMMTVTLLLVFFSAFFTDIIGVHAIFGGFLAGLIIPHKNGYAISLVEKLEDLVSLLLLPLYFTLSGLRTNLGLLNDGITWGYVILICVFAFVSKFFACGLTAKLAGFKWRESGAIGALMSCKGLVELIVLNVGLQAGILDTRVFSMFVVHALVLTFMTTPLTLWIYPAHVRTKLCGPSAKPSTSPEDGTGRRSVSDDELRTRFSIVLERLEQLPAAMTITQLLNGTPSSSATPPSATNTTAVSPSRPSSSSSTDEKGAVEAYTPGALAATGVTPAQRLTVDALRLIELTERTSAVFRGQAADALMRTDPVLAVFRTFGALNRVPVHPALSVVARDGFAGSVAGHARETGAQVVVVPWVSGPADTDEEDEPSTDAIVVQQQQNPFAGLIARSQTQVAYSQHVRRVFAQTPADVALFVDRGGAAEVRHVFVPFFGGPDDRLALQLLVQVLSANAGVRATVLRMRKSEEGAELSPANTVEQEKANTNTVFPDTVYGQPNTQTRMQSETADDLLWEKYAHPSGDSKPTAELAHVLSRIALRTETSARPLARVVDEAAATGQKQRPLLVLAGRSRRLAPESHAAELAQIAPQLGGEVPKTLGDVAAALVAKGVDASLLVVQAAH